MIVLMIPENEVRDWLLQSAEAVLDTVSELVESPQDDLLAGMAETMRQRLGLLLAVRSPAKSIPMARGRG